MASDGGIFAFGDAQYFGSMGGKPLNKPVVGIAPTPDGGGYWEAGSDGGIFTFGEPNFFGSMGGRHLNKPVVGVWSTSNGQGYWESASDGGIFNFGNAPYLGSTGGMTLNAPVVGGINCSRPSDLEHQPHQIDHVQRIQQLPARPFPTITSSRTRGPRLSRGSRSVTTRCSVSCPSTTLAKGASETCTATYRVTQADVDSGSVTNSATASANGPNGAVSSTLAVLTVAETGAKSSLSLAKSTTSTGYGSTSDMIPYTYTVTNTGTTTLHGVIVNDSATNPNGDVETVTPSCPGGNVAPGQTEVCHASYPVSQDDVDFGSVTNTAWASAVNSAEATICPMITSCPTQSVTVYADNPPDASLSVVTSTTSTFTASGQTIDYSYLVTNTGQLSYLDLGQRQCAAERVQRQPPHYCDVSLDAGASRAGHERDVYRHLHD